MWRFGNVIITSDISVPFESVSVLCVSNPKSKSMSKSKKYAVFYLQGPVKGPVEITLGYKNNL